MRNLSAAAVKAFFSPDSDEQVIMLLTLTGAGITQPIYLADSYTQRLSETDDDVIYGVKSRGNDYLFLPMEITTPSDVADAAPTAELTIHNATRQLTPLIRSITQPPQVKMELILASNPNVIEVSFIGLFLTQFKYNRDSISAQLLVDGKHAEPFPAYSFTPNYFPGGF